MSAFDSQIVGQLTFYKGSLPKAGRLFNAWDVVRRCPGYTCKYARYCPYEKRLNRGDSGACLVEKKYLTVQLKAFQPLLDRVDDPFVYQWIGMHLVPMYVDLCQLKMEKLRVEDVVYEDSKGTKRVHPIYDEIRKAHKEIFMAWKTTGLDKIARESGFFAAGGSIGTNRDPNLVEVHGDGEGYDRMASTMDEEDEDE